MKRQAVSAAFLALGLLFTACGGDDDEPPVGTDTGADATETPMAEGGTVLITAIEYAFDLPEELPAGSTTFTLENAGEEKHFIDIAKLTDDAPPVSELIELPDRKVGRFFEGQPNHIPPVKPGETSKKPLEIDLEPGRYGYVCFVEAKDGTPHAFLGMHGEFTVP